LEVKLQKWKRGIVRPWFSVYSDRRYNQGTTTAMSCKQNLWRERGWSNFSAKRNRVVGFDKKFCLKGEKKDKGVVL